MTGRRRLLLAALALAPALSGCGLSLGGARPRTAPPAPSTATALTTPSAGTTPTAPPTHTDGYSAPAYHQSVIGGWRSPVQAVEVFTATYINWTAATVTARLQALAEVSVGQARSAMSLAASETARDYELQHGEVTNSGTVEAIAPVRGRNHEYAVITQERTSAARSGAYRGLAPAWHVTLATVTRVSGGLWVLSQWQPES
ncbi:MAG TPA: hypothetical protein VFN87_00055 [Solirubrobacteraceae bacterium]|nr:hypothetical protein [Solirubrobacteraceae bacterium]